jgi:hypothetical protein
MKALSLFAGDNWIRSLERVLTVRQTRPGYCAWVFRGKGLPRRDEIDLGSRRRVLNAADSEGSCALIQRDGKIVPEVLTAP